MTYAFDTLGYAKRLRDAGVSAEAAEAHAEAAREFIMTELVTKQDLDVRLHTLELALQNGETRLERRIDGLEHRIDSMGLRLMVRFGGMLAIAVAIFAAVIKL
jgi:hypothetical protein